MIAGLLDTELQIGLFLLPLILNERLISSHKLKNLYLNEDKIVNENSQQKCFLILFSIKISSLSVMFFKYVILVDVLKSETEIYRCLIPCRHV